MYKNILACHWIYYFNNNWITRQNISSTCNKLLYQGLNWPFCAIIIQQVLLNTVAKNLEVPFVPMLQISFLSVNHFQFEDCHYTTSLSTYSGTVRRGRTLLSSSSITEKITQSLLLALISTQYGHLEHKRSLTLLPQFHFWGAQQICT